MVKESHRSLEGCGFNSRTRLRNFRLQRTRGCAYSCKFQSECFGGCAIQAWSCKLSGMYRKFVYTYLALFSTNLFRISGDSSASIPTSPRPFRDFLEKTQKKQSFLKTVIEHLLIIKQIYPFLKFFLNGLRMLRVTCGLK